VITCPKCGCQIAPSPPPLPDPQVETETSDYLAPLARYLALTVLLLSRLTGKTEDASRSALRRLEAEGLLKTLQTPRSGLLLSLLGCERCGVPWQKIGSNQNTFQDSASPSFFSYPRKRIQALIDAEVSQTFEILKTKGLDLDVPGIHRGRYYFTQDGVLSHILVEQGASSANMLHYAKRLRDKAARLLTTKGPGWKKLLESKMFCFTVLSAFDRRSSLARACREAQVPVDVQTFTVPILRLARGHASKCSPTSSSS